jgi:hypothetical protein
MKMRVDVDGRIVRESKRVKGSLYLEEAADVT